jgi:hypothetical protein
MHLGFAYDMRQYNHDVPDSPQWLSSHPQNRGWKEPWPDAKDYPL